MTKDELLETIESAVYGSIDMNVVKTAVEAYSSASNGRKPRVSCSLPEIDWVILRQKYFSECVVKDSVDGLKLRIDFAPHDLFEWFKKELTAGGNAS